jgi:hypothetical protein
MVNLMQFKLRAVVKKKLRISGEMPQLLVFTQKFKKKSKNSFRENLLSIKFVLHKIVAFVKLPILFLIYLTDCFQL